MKPSVLITDIWKSWEFGTLHTYDKQFIREILSDALITEHESNIDHVLFCCEIAGAHDIAYDYSVEIFNQIPGNDVLVSICLNSISWLVDIYPNLVPSIVFYCFHPNPDVMIRAVEAFSFCSERKNIRFPGLIVLLTNMLASKDRGVVDCAFDALRRMDMLKQVPLGIIKQLAGKSPLEFSFYFDAESHYEERCR